MASSASDKSMNTSSIGDSSYKYSEINTNAQAAL